MDSELNKCPSTFLTLSFFLGILLWIGGRTGIDVRLRSAEFRRKKDAALSSYW